jgi:hypothetical protein
MGSHRPLIRDMRRQVGGGQPELFQEKRDPIVGKTGTGPGERDFGMA